MAAVWLVPMWSGATPAQNDVYLRVYMNGQDLAVIAHFIEHAGRLRAYTEDLPALGLRTPASHDHPSIGLDALPGVRYRYRKDTQTVFIEAPDEWRLAHRIDMHPAGEPRAQPAVHSSVLNYQASIDSDDPRGIAIWTDARVVSPSAVGTYSAVSALSRSSVSHVRHETTWTFERPDDLTVLRLGDTLSSALSWSRPVRLAGLQWSRDFSLRPDIVPFARPTLHGSAALPSTVELYLDNVRHFAGRVPDGPFVLTGLSAASGAATANMVTRDALGRETLISLPLYVDARLMAGGLSSGSAEIGFLRRRYGWRSFDYDTRPAAMGSIRHGLTNALTLEAHSELASNLAHLGAASLVRLGSWGVVSASAAGSLAAAHSGMQFGAGYQFLSRRFSLDLQGVRRSPRFTDLAGQQRIADARATRRATLSAPLGRRYAAAVSYIALDFPHRPARLFSANTTHAISEQVSLTLSLFKDLNGARATTLMAGLSIALGGSVMANLSAGRNSSASTATASMEKHPAPEGGWGAGAQFGSYEKHRAFRGWTRFLGHYGAATAAWRTDGARQSAEASVEGSLIEMGGQLHAAARVDDAFAVVDTHGESGVPVLHENRVVGKTDSRGYFIVPQLNAHRRNRIAIDTGRLPADAFVSARQVELVPSWRAGVIADFPVRHDASAVIVLTDEAGAVLPLGTPVRHQASGRETIVGYDGVIFLRGLDETNLVLALADEHECEARFTYAPVNHGKLPTIGPVPCRPV